MNRAGVSFVFFMLAADAILYSTATAGIFKSEPSFALIILMFLSFNTSVIYFLLQSIKKTAPEQFIRNYRASISVKLMTSCFFILVIVLADLPHANANVTFFLTAYILQTALEVGFLFKKVNQ